MGTASEAYSCRYPVERGVQLTTFDSQRNCCNNDAARSPAKFAGVSHCFESSVIPAWYYDARSHLGYELSVRLKYPSDIMTLCQGQLANVTKKRSKYFPILKLVVKGSRAGVRQVDTLWRQRF